MREYDTILLLVGAFGNINILLILAATNLLISNFNLSCGPS